MKKRLVSGITATGNLTLGNYIGAIQKFIELQNKYEMFIFVADLHALTIDIDSETLKSNRNNIFALYLAAGLDPKKTTIFFQSDVPAHSQMGWIIETRTTIGELSRMTQFKDKSIQKQSNKTEKINTGLLTYPALMAGDILLYQPEIVPVGEDQRQHLELTKNIATRFNNEFGQTFTIPKAEISQIGSKIMSLTEPDKKMSKSSKQTKSYIALLDDPEEAYKKIQKAKTDSENKVYFSPEKQGVSNLLTIYACLKKINIKEAEKIFQNSNYGEFKQEVGLVVKEFLKDIQEKYKKNIDNIDQLAKSGALKASKVANETLAIVKQKIGL